MLEQRVGRLRRLGSLHRQIAVYAIGLPSNQRARSGSARSSTQGAPVITPLLAMRKLQVSLPLFGERLRRANRGNRSAWSTPARSRNCELFSLD